MRSPKLSVETYTLNIRDGDYFITDKNGVVETGIQESKIMEIATDAVAKLTEAANENRGIESTDEEFSEFFSILENIGIDAEFPSDCDLFCTDRTQLSVALTVIADQFQSIIY